MAYDFQANTAIGPMTVDKESCLRHSFCLHLTESHDHMKKTILFIVLAVAAIAAYFAWNAYNKAPEKMEDRGTDIQVTSTELMDKYAANEIEANALFSDKVIEVSGTISNIESGGETENIYLETSDPIASIACEMEKGQSLSALEVGQELTVKGQCTGLLMDVVLVRCMVVK